MKNLDPFIIILFGVILLAWLMPSLGVAHGNFSPSEIAGWGVSVIFLLYGLRLTPQKLKVGLSNVRLHAVIHIATFVLFPALVLMAMWVVDWRSENYYIWLGIFFVAALPSTVSSSVVMVSIAKGNVPAAIFNASISSLMGVFLTPLWMSIFISTANGGNSLNEVITKLIFQVMVPVGGGMILNRWWGRWAQKHKQMMKMFDQTVILLIVYTAFCEGFFNGMFDTVSWTMLAGLAVAMTALFFGVYYVIYWVCDKLKFNRQDRITALYCGSKKSLVHGTVMSKVIVADQSLVGIILLPIMIYHAMQLIVVSYLANKEC